MIFKVTNIHLVSYGIRFHRDIIKIITQNVMLTFKNMLETLFKHAPDLRLGLEKSMTFSNLYKIRLHEDIT